MVSYGHVIYFTNLLLLFASTVSAEEQGILQFLSAVRQRIGRPVIFIVLDENKIKLEDLSDEENRYKNYELDDPYDVRGFEENADDEAYLLYNVLKESNHGYSPIKAAKARELLKPALRIRCNKLDKCLNRCPEKKKNKCESKCQQVFDSLDACGSVQETDDCGCETQSCKKRCRGKTMPPKWRLLRNALNIEK